MVVDRCDLPESFFVNDYEFFQGVSTKKLTDHNIIDIGDREILIRMWEAFRNLKVDGKLNHGSGTFNYGDWGVWL